MSLPQRLSLLRKLRPTQVVPETPRNAEPRTGMSMGEHAAITAREWGITREEQDQFAVSSHLHLAAAWKRGFFDDLVTPYLGLQQDQNMRPDASMESLARLKPVFGKDGTATMTAGNSTQLSDGASAVLLSTDEWANERRLPILPPGRRRDGGGRLRAWRRRLADGAGLRRPATAGAQPACTAGLRFLRDPRSVRVDGACHAQGLGGSQLLQGAPAVIETARPDRSSSTERQRLIARRRPSLRGHRRTHRRDPGKTSGAERIWSRPDLHLRGRRPGRCRHPRSRVKLKIPGVPSPTQLRRYAPGQPLV